jgi:eukaryotic-like serine/threonine-protein kinase
VTAIRSGDRLGDWVVERTLGAGGMGSVYRCHSALSDEVRAAVKVLTDATSSELRQRFVQELRTLHGLSHPSIVRVLGGGTDDARGLLFIAMELVDGESLEDRLARGPMPADEAVSCFAAIADALAYAHRAGVCHRDIKPGNVMLRRDGGAVLVDFGIAVSRDRTRVTREGLLPGTLAYLPPEAFQGELPDPRSTDAYAFGVTFHEALTGASAFPVSRDGSDGQRLAQITGQKMRAEALDPGAAFSDAARDAIRATTDPEPETRVVDLAQVASRLAPGSPANQAGATNSTWSLPLSPAPKRRRRALPIVLALLGVAAVGLVGAVAVVAVGVVGGIAWFTAVTPTPRPPRPHVELAEALRSGASALESRDLASAHRYAGLALDAHPEDPNANLLYGQVLAARGDVRLARPYLCAAVVAGIDGDLGFDRAGLRCERGPAASTPLTAPLTLARVDLGEVVADADAVADSEVAAAPRDDGTRARSAARPPPAAPASAPPRPAPAPVSRLESAADAEPALEEIAAAAPPPPPPPAAKSVAEPAPRPAPSLAAPPPGLDEAAILAVVERDRAIATCRIQGLRAGAPADGAVRIRIVLDRWGAVESASIVSSTTGHAPTDACLVERVRALTFPAAEARTDRIIAVRLR